MQHLIGKTLGKYRIVARLGRGGMAEVYKAFQPGLNRYVAIKVMHDHLSEDAEFIKRFQREALATGKLSHPNIVQALDFDEESGVYYMVMQYIDGPTLKDEIKARLSANWPFSLPDIARMYLDLCDAIDYAHNRKMIHRDIKPANMMIDEEGQILLTDFGIARLVGGTQFTATGAMTGTPAYMSPEQGQGEKVDGRSDIYTMGVILYELVTGQVPYEADTPIAVVMKHITDPLPLPRTVNPKIPEAVEAIILKAMAKSPEDRFQTANAMARALRDAVGLPPGDTLRHKPLKPLALPPKIVDELNPTTGSFTAANTLGPERNEVTIMSSGSDSRPMVALSASSSKLTPVFYGIMVFIMMAMAGGFGYFALGRSEAKTSTPVIDVSATAQWQATQTAIAVAQLSESEATATAVWLAGDNDRDGLTNAEEIELNTLPDSRDTDQDDIDDADEVNRYGTNPLRSDSDGDGLKDGFEISQGLNPISDDTDGDGLPDNRDPDPASSPTPTVTNTPLPSETPLPTNTLPPTQTLTPGPTATATATPTATSPPTATPLPAMQ
ncbi:MAG: protein kinase, partial [Anaerolineae bacterium]|nr:protein kinase [Anaerolineae bacterium]